MGIAAVCGVLIVVLGYLGAFGIFQSPAPELTTIQIERAFLDLDGDGDLDFLVRGEVVLNESPKGFPTQTPP